MLKKLLEYMKMRSLLGCFFKKRNLFAFEEFDLLMVENLNGTKAIISLEKDDRKVVVCPFEKGNYDWAYWVDSTRMNIIVKIGGHYYKKEKSSKEISQIYELEEYIYFMYLWDDFVLFYKNQEEQLVLMDLKDFTRKKFLSKITIGSQILLGQKAYEGGFFYTYYNGKLCSTRAFKKQFHGSIKYQINSFYGENEETLFKMDENGIEQAIEYKFNKINTIDDTPNYYQGIRNGELYLIHVGDEIEIFELPGNRVKLFDYIFQKKFYKILGNDKSVYLMSLTDEGMPHIYKKYEGEDISLSNPIFNNETGEFVIKIITY